MELGLAVPGWHAQCLPRMYRKTLARQGPDQGERLRSFKANRAFECPEEGRSLKLLVAELKNELGVRSVYCWHHLMGYWCGLEPLSNHFEGMNPRRQEVAFTKGISYVEPPMEFSAFKMMQVGMPEGDQGAVKLYDGLHGYLHEAGIDGVKVDGQSILSQVGQGQGGGPAVSRKYISALEDSAQKHLQSASEVIAWCHLQLQAGCVLSSERWFLPRWCSFTSNLLMCFQWPVLVWDFHSWLAMFHSKHPSGEMHAALGQYPAGLFMSQIVPVSMTLSYWSSWLLLMVSCCFAMAQHDLLAIACFVILRKMTGPCWNFSTRMALEVGSGGIVQHSRLLLGSISSSLYYVQT